MNCGLGHLPTALDACGLEMIGSFNYVDNSPAHHLVMDYVEGQEKPEDWRALCMYADMILHEKIAGTGQDLNLALKCAQRAAQISKPSFKVTPPVKSIWQQNFVKTPAQVIYDITQAMKGRRSSVTSAKLDTIALKAMRDDALNNREPRFMAESAEHEDVKKHSSLWVELTTQAAMNGNKHCMWEIGLYYLQKSGWFPRRGFSSPSSTPENRLGFEWIMAYAYNMDSLKRYHAYAFLAHVYRDWKLYMAGASLLEQHLNTLPASDTTRVTVQQDLKVWKGPGKLQHFEGQPFYSAANFAREP